MRIVPDVTICDVGPRDGLQSEPRVLAPSERAALCRELAECGLRRVEAVSFVDARRVPAMAGAEAVVAELPEGTSVEWSGLVLNERGYEQVVACGLRDVNFVLPATDAFSVRNQGRSVHEVLDAALCLLARAREDRVRLSVTIAAAFGCPFEGRVPVAEVLELAEAIVAGKPFEVSLADTIGVGVPTRVRELVSGVVAMGQRTACHFHDTRNTGIANAIAALEAGASTLDASVGGAGGCPFAPGATGNLATEDLAWTLEEMGIRTGLDIDGLVDCAHRLERLLGRPLPSAIGRAGIPFREAPRNGVRFAPEGVR